MADRCLVVVAGTPDIHLPLYRALREELREPVVLIDGAPSDALHAELDALLRHHAEVWCIPANEIALNNLARTASRITDPANGLFIPGTASRPRRVQAVELSDKGTLHKLIADQQFSAFRTARTVCARLQALSSEEIGGLTYPIVVKPAAKDETDSFTRAYPAKIAVASDPTELSQVVDTLNTDPDRHWVFQEIVRGADISWCGSIMDGETAGYAIVPEIKSPRNDIGGTTTLARIEPAGSALEEAVRELASRIKLDGIFEIEFVQDGDSLTFFFEINPRPWLQIALVLELVPCPIVQYFKSKGFTARAGSQRRSTPPARWGSAARYMELNRGHVRLSLREFLLTAAHDVRFTRHFTWLEKARYSASLAKGVLWR
jgi:hypothetical protein